MQPDGSIPVTWFRVRVVAYILLFSLFVLWWTNRPPARSASDQPNQAAAHASSEVESQPSPGATPPALPEATVATPPAPAPATATVSLPEPILLGGLLRPDQAAWDAPMATDPLASLLQQALTRTLLDPLTGAAALAERWTIEGNRAVFTLAPDATGQDGTPLRAAEVVALLRQAQREEKLPALQSAQALNEQTVQVDLTTTEAICPALMQVATWPLASAAPQAQGQDRWQITPQLAYRAFPDELALRAAWQQGEIDGIVGASKLTMGPLPGASQPSQQSGPLLATLLWKLDAAPVADARVREALTLATDRAALFADAYGFAPPALLSALLPPGHWAAPTQALAEGDATRAASLLTEAGWRDRDGDGTRENAAGEPLRVTLTLPLSPDPRWEQLAHSLAAQWATVGVELKPLFVEAYSLQERLHADRWQVALLAYRVAAEPDQRALWAAPTDLIGSDLNVTGYANPDVTELLTEGATLAGCAPDARARLYHEAWTQLLADRPLWPLFPLPLDLVQRPDGG